MKIKKKKKKEATQAAKQICLWTWRNINTCSTELVQAFSGNFDVKDASRSGRSLEKSMKSWKKLSKTGTLAVMIGTTSITKQF